MESRMCTVCCDASLLIHSLYSFSSEILEGIKVNEYSFRESNFVNIFCLSFQ